MENTKDESSTPAEPQKEEGMLQALKRMFNSGTTQPEKTLDNAASNLQQVKDQLDSFEKQMLKEMKAKEYNMAKLISNKAISSTYTSSVSSSAIGAAKKGPASPSPSAMWASGSAGVGMGSVSGGSVTMSPVYTTSMSYAPPNIITLMKDGNKEILRVTPEGKVEWAEGHTVDDAAEAFGKSITLGTEIAAGVTSRVKGEMRDVVFEEIIEMSKIKGVLTTHELTLMFESAKIMEKLKGSRK